ncbi:Zinc finger MYM-type protein 1 [Holothuria leucospilota]|uniref:Zinc finger MYM-type protein 1 n=1 Tax=Holothuria leucospilota TaxID=206669 RepID=A0A9Q1H5F7_HOLLE|nr:Zinc finger MYM-type protein 1 [Holothuria leucospilota]
MGFRCAEGLDAESLSESILDELKSEGIDINNLVGQGYDGASVMNGKLSGVQERIRRKIPQTLYVHCFAHRLNLVIVETVKSVVPVVDFFAVLQSSYNFLSGSHIHKQWIKWQQKMYPKARVVEFKGMSDTRWASQVRTVGAIRKRFHCFVEFFRHIDTNDDNRDRALNARGLLSQLDQTFIYCMLLMDEVLTSANLQIHCRVLIWVIYEQQI